ncbi:GT2 family glycosyltransferase [Desulfomicrobium macestii]|uniref:GT2 family glycosyltransferase n=1 Tax=Desulfomicrobium macestii TaxID=90731 RepID=A0ABR9H5Q3_9BACT|nr:glycosyltransferase [Desulfomicrobium macestii]MBE1426053.1 GT2 family glycosyltransferase [Desulfomicrobium macestii]
MSTSIIIPTLNNASLIYSCIKSILKVNTIADTDIIVIDNASTDETKFLLQNFTNSIKLITNNANLGFSKACNQGAKSSRADFLIFLNNDTEVTRGWLEGLLRCLHSNFPNSNFPNSNFPTGIVGCKLLYPDSTVQHAGVAFSSIKVHHIYRNFAPSHPAVNKQREFQAVTAACMLVPRKLFLSLGGFDESFINGFEDLDFCFRARSKGYKVMYTPESVVIHHESKTPGRHDHHAHNARLFASRWLSNVDHDLDKIYAEDGLRRHLEYEEKLGGKWLEDSNPNHFWNQARSLVISGEYVEAEKFFGQALSFNPYDVRRLSIAEELSDLYMKWGRVSDAEQCLDAVIQVTPSKRLLQKKARIAMMATHLPSDLSQK